MTEGCVPEKSIAHRMVGVPWSFLWDVPGDSLESGAQSFKVDYRMDTSDCFVFSCFVVWGFFSQEKQYIP